jgi:ABC-type nitrate/sulfonate/bicarbonate transport system permease component
MSGVAHGTSALRRARARVAPILGLVPLVVGLGLWQIFGTTSSAYFPAPSAWIDALVMLWNSGDLGTALSVTVIAYLWGFSLCVVIGVSLGLAVGRNPAVDRALGPAFELGRTMPAGALVPVAVLLMGYTSSTTLSVVVLSSVWPILLNTRSGAIQVSASRIDTARTFRLSRIDTFRKVLVPSIMPNILLGVRVAAPIILIVLLLVEIVTQESGIGREIAIAQQQFQSATVYGLVALTGLFGLLVNWIIGAITHLGTRALIRKPRPAAQERGN